MMSVGHVLDHLLNCMILDLVTTALQCFTWLYSITFLLGFYLQNNSFTLALLILKYILHQASKQKNLLD